MRRSCRIRRKSGSLASGVKLAVLGRSCYFLPMHISFAVFADGANLSQEGKLNVLGVFDALAVGGFPAVHPRTHFVVRLKGNVEDAGAHR